jgi:hypothetical protein
LQWDEITDRFEVVSGELEGFHDMGSGNQMFQPRDYFQGTHETS